MQIFFFSFHCFYTGLVLRRIRTKYLALTSLLMNLIFCFFFANFILFSILPQRQHGTLLSENKDWPTLLYFKGRSIGIGFVPFITPFSTRPVCYPFISIIQILISLTKLFPCISQIMKNVTATSTSRYFLVLENINLHCFYVYQLSNI